VLPSRWQLRVTYNFVVRVARALRRARRSRGADRGARCRIGRRVCARRRSPGRARRGAFADPPRPPSWPSCWIRPTARSAGARGRARRRRRAHESVRIPTAARRAPSAQTLLTASIVPRAADRTHRIGERIACDVVVSGSTGAALPTELVYTVAADGDTWLAAGTTSHRFLLPVRERRGWPARLGAIADQAAAAGARAGPRPSRAGSCRRRWTWCRCTRGRCRCRP